MKAAHFKKMSIFIPIRDGETLEEIEDKFLEAIDTIDHRASLCYALVEEDIGDIEEEVFDDEHR